MRMPDSAGFSSYTESGILLPALHRVNTSTSPRKCISTTSRRLPAGAKYGTFPKNTDSPNSP
ncbi:hypothetical protein [Pseudomonas shahriarae]|uniref:hypothetical protein n=1 Tax=Pseudomonas shahriarae TaxID=2745512 RepID=UPI003CC7CE60